MDLPQLFVDDNQIQQVFVNLFLNAAQAMPAGGELYVEHAASSGARTMVEIVVRDTGKGIPPEYLPHIFDPFFSTKEEGGTGLGLSVSYSIIKNHGGQYPGGKSAGRRHDFYHPVTGPSRSRKESQ